MYGKYPRSLYLILQDSLPEKDEAYNYWVNYIHIPDVLDSGIFDRVYRYEAIGEAKAKYLTVWESDYTDLTSQLVDLSRLTEDLRSMGRIWPVFQTIWTQAYFTVGPAKAHNHKHVTFMTTTITNCGSPSRDGEFNKWYNDMHLPEFLGTGYYHSAYRYQTLGDPPDEQGKFLALYESDFDTDRLPQLFEDLKENWMLEWYEPLGGTQLKIRQQIGEPSRPKDLILEMVPGWAFNWKSISISDVE